MDVQEAERILRKAGLLTDVLAGQLLQIRQGDVVRMSVSFQYRGPATTVTLRCSIGTRIAGIFNESVYGLKTIALPNAYDWVTRTEYADINTAGCSPSLGYDVEAKISEYTSATLVKIDNVIDILGAAEFRNFAITEYVKLA